MTKKTVLKNQENSAFPDASARSNIYQQLSKLFIFPSSANARVPFSETFSTINDAITVLPYPDETITKLLGTINGLKVWTQESGLEYNSDCTEIYTALFDNCSGRVAIPLHEKEYGNTETKVVWEELIRFYEHFGLGFNVEKSGDWPDYIGTELEFMHYLCYMEATALPSEDKAYIQGQKDFISRHLACWVSAFSDRLNETDNSTPYDMLARLANDVIHAEMKWLDISATQQPPWGQGSGKQQPGRFIPVLDLPATPTK